MSRLLIVLLVLGLAPAALAQPLFTDALPIEELAQRRARVMAAIGDGVAVVQGAAEVPAYGPFRQNNQFFYLTGVEVPRALVLIDGRAKTTTLFLQPRDERWERSEGPILVPGDETVRITGVEAAVPYETFATVLTDIAQQGRTLYTPHRPEVLGAGTPNAVVRHQTLTTADLWDGRPSRVETFIIRIKARVPQLRVEDLDPVVDALRLVKSPREIALIREATRISTLGILEAMKASQPGMYEYELAAVSDYLFTKHNAQGYAYFALVAAGANAHYPHYHASQSMLKDGDFVLYDYAPDFKYYTADVTRMFPANGKFTPWQKELYTVYLRLYRSLMTSIRPGVTAEAIIKDAVVKMQDVLRTTTFTDPKIETAARTFVERYLKGSPRTRLGHWVGMEVHDVDAPAEVLKPGMVFTIEPPITIPEGRVYVRLEDMILVTETGYENLSESLPYEVADIEKAMAADGLGERKPARGSASAATPQRRSR
jgi:Xaa-Pro aminopeptidase